MKEAINVGSVVKMSGKSGVSGFGNLQCVSHICESLGELGLYGHNKHYKIRDVEKVISNPLAWISVDDMLPVAGQNVLATCGKTVETDRMNQHHMSGERVWQSGQRAYTHWMPEPKLPTTTESQST